MLGKCYTFTKFFRHNNILLQNLYGNVPTKKAKDIGS